MTIFTESETCLGGNRSKSKPLNRLKLLVLFTQSLSYIDTLTNSNFKVFKFHFTDTDRPFQPDLCKLPFPFLRVLLTDVVSC